MFLDRVKIKVKAGNGGNGAVSFLRTKLSMNGGPDGGNGGKGGDIIFRATTSLDTLYSFRFNKHFFAGDGEKGDKATRNGKDGKDIIINVPCGTVIYDADTNLVIADILEEGQTFTALKGGNGGKGNAYFATSTRQAPKFSQTGEITKQRELILELKTIADVGLVGFPNVGKSTLLSTISNAKPKIANYHFTTLVPNLGVVAYYDNSFVVADIPGLIEGASEGLGLGITFLKHIERVRVIVHMIDISESENRDAYDDYLKINTELQKYSEKLASLKQILVFTKCDLLDEEMLQENLKKFEKELKNHDYVCISSITQRGLDELKGKIWNILKDTPKTPPTEIELFDYDKKDNTSVYVEMIGDGEFEVTGGLIDNLIRGVVISDEISFAYFQKRLKETGIIDMLLEKGLKDGDTVHIKDIEFEYFE